MAPGVADPLGRAGQHTLTHRQDASRASMLQGHDWARLEVRSFIRPMDTVGKSDTVWPRRHSSGPRAHLFFPKGIS